jgi:hypothetical protein
MPKTTTKEDAYLKLLVAPIRVCATYKPKMGSGPSAGLTLADFKALYGADPFYSWFGLDHPLMYAAHKAAGGMTSVYRQVGIGCERLFRAILQDELGLNAADCVWSYETAGSGAKARRLSLDARIPLAAVSDTAKRKRIQRWMDEMADELQLAKGIKKALQGVVFEVRQGYKSKDSKRQNADIANAATAYSQAYMPSLVIMSGQIDSDVAARYQLAKWVLLKGVAGKASSHVSTYTFVRDVIGYDLARFLENHKEVLRSEIATVLKALLSTE